MLSHASYPFYFVILFKKIDDSELRCYEGEYQRANNSAGGYLNERYFLYRRKSVERDFPVCRNRKPELTYSNQVCLRPNHYPPLGILRAYFGKCLGNGMQKFFLGSSLRRTQVTLYFRPHPFDLIEIWTVRRKAPKFCIRLPR